MIPLIRHTYTKKPQPVYQRCCGTVISSCIRSRSTGRRSPGCTVLRNHRCLMLPIMLLYFHFAFAVTSSAVFRSYPNSEIRWSLNDFLHIAHLVKFHAINSFPVPIQVLHQAPSLQRSLLRRAALLCVSARLIHHFLSPD